MIDGSEREDVVRQDVCSNQVEPTTDNVLDTEASATDQASASEFQSTDSDESDFLTAPSAAEQIRKKKSDRLFSALLIVLIVLLIASLAMRFFVGCRINVVGESMEPNFHSGDSVWVNKSVEPKRGDVVVLYKNSLTGAQKIWAEFSLGKEAQIGGKYEKLIKRVVALAGDKLWVEQTADGFAVVVKTAQGEVLREDWYTVSGVSAKFYNGNGGFSAIPVIGDDHLGNLKGRESEENAFVVPEGCFYFMGDNRNNSADSRSSFGALPLTNVYGVVGH